MNNPKDKGSQGFTLVEILFALFIGGILVSAIYFVLISGQKSSMGIERKVAAQGDVRSALEIMGLEIGMASYNPFFSTGIWRPAPASPSDIAYCTNISTNQTFKGIQEATPTSILVEMDIGENGSIGSPDLSELIRYEYDAANEYITRQATCGGREPFLGASPASGDPRNVRVINNSLGIRNGVGNTAIFRYFTANNPATELYPGATPNDIPRIRRIDITLAVATDEVDPSTNARRQMIYTTSVIPRNHVITQ